MKKLLSTFFACSILLAFTSSSFANKPVKVKVSQDTFVQGGETADEELGSTTADRLRVMKSNGNDKYSRTTYLQFNLKKIEAFESATLHINVRVYPSKTDAAASFTMQVYGADNSPWNEASMTFSNKPEKQDLLATQTLSSSDKNQWITINLPADGLKELIKNSKKGRITLVLANDDFNKTSAEIISKERTWSNGTPANSEAYLSFQ